MIFLVSSILLPTAVRTLKKRLNFVLISFFIYLLGLILSVILSIKPFLSLAVLILNLGYFIIFLSSAEILKTQKMKELLLLVFLVIVTVLSLISFYNTYVSGYNNLSSEGVSFMWAYYGHNHLAVLLIMAIPITVYFIFALIKKWEKIFFVSLLFFFLFSLLVSFSRSAILALMLAFIFAGIVFGQSYIRKMSFKKLFIFGVLMSILALSLALVINLKSLRSINSRMTFYQKGIEMFLQRPITGYGLYTFNQAKQDSDLPASGAFFAHNLLVQNLAEGGVILFLGTIMLFLSMGVYSVKAINKVTGKIKVCYVSLWIGLAGILMNEMADFDMQLPAVGLLFWAVAGLIIFGHFGKDPSEKDRGGGF